MRIRFLSANPHKIQEANDILAPSSIAVVPLKLKVDEIQTTDTAAMLRDKAARAFYRIGHPLFVEQTGLYIDRLNGFPGGLTQVFWDTLGPDRVSDLFGQGTGCGVTAKTHIGYCDGKRVHLFEGQIRGSVVPSPRGDRAFQWDCIFVPEGETQTFAEMGMRKNDISMRRIALTKFAAFLLGKSHA